MCGRYTLRTPLPHLLALYMAEASLDDILELQPRYNISPTQNVAIVRHIADRPPEVRELTTLRWGLVPPWADDLSIGNRMLNARSETITEKTSFKRPLASRRCIVLADGFYEWQKVGKIKQPYLIEIGPSQPIAFAGLWERWSKSGDPIETCTIITTSANATMSALHERMPAILDREAIDAWLDPRNTDLQRLAAMLVPYKGNDLRMQQVSMLVNSPKNDVPACAAPLPEQLF